MSVVILVECFQVAFVSEHTCPIPVAYKADDDVPGALGILVFARRAFHPMGASFLVYGIFFLFVTEALIASAGD